jgi:hypothetical protein
MPTKVFDAFTRLDASDVNAYLANKSISNAVINGGFDIWQRGTSFTNPSNAYIADRWWTIQNGGGGTLTVSRQPFTPGELTNTGSGEYPFYLRFALTGTETGATVRVLDQRIEDVRTLAAQTVTLSFWAKADASRTISTSLTQSFGSGGSPDVGVSGGSFSLTTSWQRFTTTVNLASTATKTIGVDNYLVVRFSLPINVAHTVDIFGVQLEPGTVANDFRRNSDSLAGELAACQRYYQVRGGGSAFVKIGMGVFRFGDTVRIPCHHIVEMRAAPSFTPTAASTFAIESDNSLNIASFSLDSSTTKVTTINVFTSSSTTPGFSAMLQANNNLNARIEFNAEL